MSNLSNILPQTPEQKRQMQEAIAVAERPIKELIFAYFKLFEKSAGPKFRQYREIAETINDFRELPSIFTDPQALAYLPGLDTQLCPVEEVCVSSGMGGMDGVELWEMWELRPTRVPDNVGWDVDARIASLDKLEAARINARVGELLHVIQVSWNIIVSRYSQTKNWKLHLHPNNLTLSLIDPTHLSKADHLKTRVGITIVVKDKIEISKKRIEDPKDPENPEKHDGIEGKN